MLASTESIEIVVNGEPRRVPPNQTLAALLGALNIPAERVAVELNRSIVRKRDWAQTPVETGANIEVVEFVGGG